MKPYLYTTPRSISTLMRPLMSDEASTRVRSRDPSSHRESLDHLCRCDATQLRGSGCGSGVNTILFPWFPSCCCSLLFSDDSKLLCICCGGCRFCGEPIAVGTFDLGSDSSRSTSASSSVSALCLNFTHLCDCEISTASLSGCCHRWGQSDTE